MSQRSLGRVTVTFVAAALLLAPLTAPESADAASTTPPVIRLGYDVYEGALSPNGDGSQDNVRIRFNLASRSDVIVTVRRNDTDRTVVYRKKLGRLSGGGHAWQWNGRNPRGKPVRDGRYSAIFVADQVAQSWKDIAQHRQRLRRHLLRHEVDTEAQRRHRVPAHDADPGQHRGHPGQHRHDPMTDLGRVVST